MKTGGRKPPGGTYMAKYYYAAFIPAGENWFSIFCPDFPEVASQGESVGE